MRTRGASGWTTDAGDAPLFAERVRYVDDPVQLSRMVAPGVFDRRVTAAAHLTRYQARTFLPAFEPGDEVTVQLDFHSAPSAGHLVGFSQAGRVLYINTDT